MNEEMIYTVLVNGHVTARGLSQAAAWREAEATEALRPDVRVTIRPEAA